jgi:hypothetical protein
MKIALRSCNVDTYTHSWHLQSQAKAQRILETLYVFEFDRTFETMVARWPETSLGGVHVADFILLSARISALYLLRLNQSASH